MMRKAFSFVFTCTIVVITAAAKKPNIILVVTDDQDLLLGGFEQMGKVKAYIADLGVTFVNSYGRKENGGAEHVPPGWDWWLGLVGNSKYYNYSLSVNGTKKDFSSESEEYLTSVISNYSMKFLEYQTSYQANPFLMVLAPPAPHAPFTPEDKYNGAFNGTKVPRTPNFNLSPGKTKHWLARLPPNPLPDNIIKNLDKIQQLRLETLLSVDDLVGSVFTKLQERFLLNNTYIMFTSDNGFHLGQFGFTWDKRQMYETDIRVPLVMSGPNIPKKRMRHSPVLNIDIAVTLLDMAGIYVSPDLFDGTSFLSTANGSESDTQFRSMLIEYSGEGNERHSIDPNCPWFYDNNLSQCSTEADCKCQDARNNSYACLRKHFLPDENYVYCEFDDIEFFREYYDLINDPYQINNTVFNLEENCKANLKKRLKKFKTCRGLSCHKYQNEKNVLC